MRANASEPIRIDRMSGHQLLIPDSFRETVGDFQTTRFEGSADGQVSLVKRSLLDESEMSRSSAGFTFPAAGLLPAMRYAAALRNVLLATAMSDIRELPAPVCSPLSRNPAISHFIRDYVSGVIEFGGRMKVEQIIAEVCLAFPSQRILAVSPHRRELRHVSENVRRYAPLVGVADVSHGGLPYDVQDVSEVASRQLVLATPLTSGLLYDTADLDVREFPIVLYLNAARARDLLTTGFMMASHARFRIFGLRHVGSEFRGEESDLALNVFGPAFVRIPDNGVEQSEVSYVFLENRFKLQNSRRRSSPVDVVRLTQHCTQRNNLVANFARPLADGSRFEGDELVQYWLQQHQIERPSVAIFVSTYLHAARLAKRLPDWSIFWRSDSAEIQVGLAAKDRRLIDQRASNRPCNSQVICPLDYVSSFLKWADPEIIVVASGGIHAPVFPERWFQHPAGTQRQRLVIDLFDGATALTRRLSNKRMAEYRFPDFLPVMRDSTREAILYVQPLLNFVERTFRPARRRSSR